MKGFIKFVIIILLLLGFFAGTFVFLFLEQGDFLSKWLVVKKKVKVSVSVMEGLVSVSDLDNNLLKMVAEGEVFETVTIVEEPLFQTNFITPLVKPILPQTVNIYKKEMGRLTEPVKHLWIFKRIYTEEEFDEHIIQRLEKDDRISDITIKFSPEGFSGTAKIRLGAAVLVGRASGVVKARDGKFVLELDKIGLGNIRLSRFIREELERAFNSAVSSADSKIEAKEVVFRNGGMEITFLRKDRYRLKDVGYGGIPDKYALPDDIKRAVEFEEAKKAAEELARKKAAAVKEAEELAKAKEAAMQEEQAEEGSLETGKGIE